MQARTLPCVLLEKFLNIISAQVVFMNEGARFVVGEAILTEVGTVAQSRGEIVELLVRQHARLVYRIAYAVLRSHHDAEDATQETFVRLLRYGKNLDKVEDTKTWLARIAWRVAVDRSRQRSRKQEISLDDPEKPLAEIASDAIPADATLQSSEAGWTLERLIEALPKKLREPLILSTLEEMSPREVAVTLGISEAAVRSRAFRARQILREKLKGMIGTEVTSGAHD
jgi:RNA polymerase sigma-70 factor (ECF subfamily)